MINGEKTELDKRMIDELSDPLIHLVRNSADHGIELPEVREAAGKPPQGTVSLNAYHRGNSIVIQVSDDGKGLDAERIRRKAIQNGLISEADAEKMTPRQIHALIWAPGLSTAEKVTEVSGRGMGMDIVKSKIDELNGDRRDRQRTGTRHDPFDQAPADAGHSPQLDGADRRGRVRHAAGIGGRNRPPASQRPEHGLPAVDRPRPRPRDFDGPLARRVRLGGAATARDAGVDDEVTLVILGQMGTRTRTGGRPRARRSRTSSSNRWPKTTATSPASPAPAFWATAGSP